MKQGSASEISHFRMTHQSDQDLKKIFEKYRICGGIKDTLLTCIYFPLGFVLCVVRLFMLFHIYITSLVLPIHTFIGRMIQRFMLVLCGLAVTVRDEDHRRDACPVVVCNYISPVDRLMFSLIQPNIMANEWGLPPFVSMLFGLKDLNEESSRDTFLQNARILCQHSSVPLFTRPEGLPTSGKHALLKFSTWQFSISDSVQPVVLQAKRPMPISLTTLTSSGLFDMLYVLFTPYTLFTVRYLPVVQKEEGESPDQFAERTRELMASSLNLSLSPYSRHDRNELVKRLHKPKVQSGSACRGNSRPATERTATPPTCRVSEPLCPRLEAMVQHCKQVTPQVPLDVLRALITKTEDAEHTLGNIFEGNIQYVPEVTAPPSTPTPCTSPSAKQPLPAAENSVPPSGSSQTYAADVFAKQSCQRHLSLADRKKAMLTEARLRYIKIHGFSITLEQIENQQF